MSLLRSFILLTVISLVILSPIAYCNQPIISSNSLNTALTPTQDYSNSDSGLEECTSIIVAGRAAKNGRAILMKNRDSSQTRNVPIYHPSTNNTYAFVAVNSMWMGINEWGLAVMNTAMPALAEGADIGSYNGILNRRILENCQNVSDVIASLFAREEPLVPEDAAVATCVGVVDRHGRGAFLEISSSQVSVEYVENGYQSRANHPRTFPGLASGPDGRDQYALDELEEIYNEKGSISWQDVAQRVSRYVRDKETQSGTFSIDGEVCNPYTVSAMVAVSGDDRYDGALNTMWCTYGQVPMIGVFLPSMVYPGTPPTILSEMVHYTATKRNQTSSDGSIYSASGVREIQDYAFAAENYTFEQYDRLMDQIPLGLSTQDLNTTLTEFIDLTVSVAADMYVNETTNLPNYAIPFEVTAIPEITLTTISTTSTTMSNSSLTISQTPTNVESLGLTIIGFSSGFVAMLVIYVGIIRKMKD